MPTIPINDTTPRKEYTATVGQTVFAYDFWISAEEDLEVYKNGTLLTLTTDYSVSGVLETSGGNVTLVSGASAGDVIIISRAIPVKREAEFQTGGAFQASVLNMEQSKEIAILQQFKRDISRKIGLDVTATYAGELDLPAAQASAIIGWNASGDGLTNYTTVPYQAPNGANVPAITGGDAGKLVKVKTDESGFEYAATLATPAGGDAGKITKVNATEDGLDFGPTITTPTGGDAGKIAKVNSGETGYDLIALGTGLTTGGGSLAVDVGTGANQVVQLDGSAKLPAIDGSQLTGIPGGKVLQVVANAQGSSGTQTTTSATYTDVSGMSVTITPSSTSSKILVLAVVPTGYQGSGGSTSLNIDRGGSSVAKWRRGTGLITGTSSDVVYAIAQVSYLDSPATTSATTYKLQFASDDPSAAGGTARIEPSSQRVMLALEISA